MVHDRLALHLIALRTKPSAARQAQEQAALQPAVRAFAEAQGFDVCPAGEAFFGEVPRRHTHPTVRAVFGEVPCVVGRGHVSLLTN
jgi:hypothetical protein